MKLKGITKLVLAGTALAATAATLTTSTYAWYVTNASVDAKGVSGAVASTSTGSLYIAKNTVVSDNNLPDVYKTDITLSKAGTETDGSWKTSDLAVGKFTADDLEPQSKAKFSSNKYYYVTADESKQDGKTYYKESTESTGTFVAAADADWGTDTKIYEAENNLVWVDDKGKAIMTNSTTFSTGKLISFKYWLKSNAGGQVDVELKVDNTTAAATPQIALAEDGLPGGVVQGNSFVADAVHALRMEVKQTAYDVATSFVAATGTYVSGTKYYTTAAGTTPVDTTGFTSETDVTSYFVAQKNYTAIEVAANSGSAAPVTYQVAAVALDKTGANYDTTHTTAYTRTTDPIAFVTGGDANNYYTSIIGTSPYNVTSGTSNDASTGSASWGSITLAANKDTLLEFSIWLEGSDADCWDSARGQSFTFDFQFKLHASA